jgi:hypothetical protein
MAAADSRAKVAAARIAGAARDPNDETGRNRVLCIPVLHSEFTLPPGGSGVIGRYLYTRLHARLDGTEDSLEHLKTVGERLRTQSRSLDFVPALLDTFDAMERRLITPPKGALARLLHLCTGTLRVALARHLVRRATKLAVRRAVRVESPLIARHAYRLAEVARRYAYRRIDAGRRVAEYQLYARLFSYRHVLLIPPFFVLLVAGIAHLIMAAV